MVEIVPNWHPPLVHLTVGLLFCAAVAYVLAALPLPAWLRRQGLIAARWGLFAGVLITVATVIAGFQAYGTVAHDGPGHDAMTVHRNWALATAALFAVVAILEAWRASRSAVASVPVALLMLAGALLLAVTGFHGGELVFRHGIGVQSLPRVEESHHGAGVGADHHGGGENADRGDAVGGSPAGSEPEAMEPDGNGAADTGHADGEADAGHSHDGHDHEH